MKRLSIRARRRQGRWNAPSAPPFRRAGSCGCASAVTAWPWPAACFSSCSTCLPPSASSCRRTARQRVTTTPSTRRRCACISSTPRARSTCGRSCTPTTWRSIRTRGCGSTRRTRAGGSPSTSSPAGSRIGYGTCSRWSATSSSPKRGATSTCSGRIPLDGTCSRAFSTAGGSRCPSASSAWCSPSCSGSSSGASPAISAVSRTGS